MLPVVSVIVVFTQSPCSLSVCSCILHCLSADYHLCMGGHSLATHMLGGGNNLNDRHLMWVANRQTG